MPQRLLRVPYREQVDTIHCGAACLQMVLLWLREESPHQPALLEAARAGDRLDRENNWSTAPDGIVSVLNDTSDVAASDFQVAMFDSDVSLTRWAIWNVFRGVPPIVLVKGWAHWVVLFGYRTSADPIEPGDSGYDIHTLHFHDPWDGQDHLEVGFEVWQRDWLWRIPHGYWKDRVLGVGVVGPGPVVAHEWSGGVG